MKTGTSTDNMAKPIIKDNQGTYFQLRCSLLLRLLTYTSIYLDEDNSGVIHFLALSICVMELIEAINYSREESKKSRSVKHEIAANPSKSNNKVEVFDEHPFMVKQSIFSDDFDGVEYFKWNIGESRLYNHIVDMINIFDRLKKEKIKNLPKTPRQFHSYHRFLPHSTPSLDYPSKARLFDFFLFPGMLAGKYLSAYFKFSSTNTMIFTVVYTALNWCSSARESYLLHDQKLRLNLEGFNFKYAQWLSITPTCIGQQCTRKIVFHPNNYNIKTLLTYVLEGERSIRYLLKKNPQDSAIHQQLANFPFALERNVTTFFSIPPKAKKLSIEEKRQHNQPYSYK